MKDEAIEQEIQAKGLTIGPRVTLEDIEAEIVAERYFTAEDGIVGSPRSAVVCPEHSLLTFCVLSMRNGFTVTGESACVSPENFDAEVGRKIARQNAIAKLWPLMGFALADRRSRGVGEFSACDMATAYADGYACGMTAKPQGGE